MIYEPSEEGKEKLVKRQEIIGEKELPKYLENDWNVESNLPSGQLVVSKMVTIKSSRKKHNHESESRPLMNDEKVSREKDGNSSDDTYVDEVEIKDDIEACDETYSSDVTKYRQYNLKDFDK